MEFVGDVVVSDDAKTAWIRVTTFINVGVVPSKLVRVDIDPNSATYGQRCLEHTFPGEIVWTSHRDHDGILHLISYTTAFQATLHEIDTNTKPSTILASTRISSPPVGTFSLGALEPAIGGLVTAIGPAVPGQPAGWANTVAFATKRSGILTVIASAPAGGWCIPYTIDVHSSFERYGAGTPGTNAYRIVDCPAPGGPPSLGNGNFEVVVQTSGVAAQLPWLVLGVTPWRDGRQIAGIELYTAPLIVLEMSAQGAISRAPLPLPHDPALLHAAVYAQGIHLESGGVLATSDAVHMTIH